MADELATSNQELVVEPAVADISASSEPAVIASAPESHDMPPPAHKRKGRPPAQKTPSNEYVSLLYRYVLSQ